MAYIGIGPASFTNNLTNVQILDDIKSGFNGSTTAFNLTANSVPFQAVSDRALMVILGGVIQAPGVDYTINGTQITFTTAPVSGLTFYARNIYGLNALNGVNDGIVGPYSLTTGGPSWDTSGNTTISGNLTVQGATTTIQSTTLDVIDKDIKLASNQSTNAGIDTAGLLWGTTSVKLKYYNNGGTNPGLNIEGTKVGIGVTAPIGKLHIFEPTQGNNVIQLNSGDGYPSVDRGLDIKSGAGGYAGSKWIFDAVSSGGQLEFQTTGTPRLLIDQNGKVGIGADAPDCLLHIQGTEISGYGAHANTKLCVEHDGNTAIEIVSSANYLGGIYFSDSGADGVGKIEYYHGTGGDNMRFNTNGDERLRIDSSGNLRFGQTTQITCNTTDGSDNQAIYIGGGGGSSQTRGAQVLLHGNEYAGGYNGTLELLAGNTGNTQGTIDFFTAGNKRVTIKSTGHLKLPDDGKIEFGGAQNVDGDLQIYHAAGADSTIHHTATSGSTLRLRSRGFTFKNQANSETIATLNEGDACKLFYSNAEKIATTSTGISVTGEVAATQDYPSYRPEFDFNFAAVKKLDPRMIFTRSGEASYHDGIGSVKFVPDNVPRFDHDIVTGECKGLLVELAGTNFSKYSRRFDVIASGSWVPQNGGATPTITANTHTAPDGISSGVYMADTITGATGTAFNGNVVQQQYTAASNVKHTFSLYVKLLTATQATIYIRDGGTGSVSSTSAVNTKDWQRLVVTSSAALTNATVHSFYIGNTNGTIAVWGSQIENKYFVSSYMRNVTDSSNGTRAADFPRLEGEEFNDMISQETGTLIAEFDNVRTDGYVLSIDNGAPKIGMVNNNNYQMAGKKDDGGSLGTTDNGTVLNGTNKFALAYEVNNAAISINGNTASVDTSFSPLPTTTRLWFGLREGQYDHLGSAISRVIYYKQRLSNSQLKTLTS